MPRNAPQKVKVSPGSAAGTLRVTWDYRTCDKMADDAYVTRFVIFYCSQFDAVSGKCRLGECWEKLCFLIYYVHMCCVETCLNICIFCLTYAVFLLYVPFLCINKRVFIYVCKCFM